MKLLREQFEKNKKLFIIAAVVVVVALVCGAAYYYQNKRSHTYYAVFLTNNQVYFGNLDSKDGDYISLKNVSYLQAPNPQNPQQVQLVRRGSELHSPTGDMLINRDQVLFLEELTSSSQVVKTIETYKQGQAK